MKKFKYLVFTCFLQFVFAGDISGVYEVESNGNISYVEVFQKDGKFYAVGFANKNGKDSGKDIKNPNPALRDRNIGGSVFLWNLQKIEDDKYVNGKVYSFDNGVTYYVSAKQEGNTLKLRASKDKNGVIGKKLEWRKLNSNEIKPYESYRYDVQKLQLPK